MVAEVHAVPQLGAHPSVAVAQPWIGSRRCGQEYQEGTAAESPLAFCACGTIAIGRCKDCYRYVDGIHSRLVDGQRLCDECRKARVTEAEAAAKAQDWADHSPELEPSHEALKVVESRAP